jgi:hypothetical protein
MRGVSALAAGGCVKSGGRRPTQNTKGSLFSVASGIVRVRVKVEPLAGLEHPQPSCRRLLKQQHAAEYLDRASVLNRQFYGGFAAVNVSYQLWFVDNDR